MKFAPTCAFSAVVACLVAQAHGVYGASLRNTNDNERKLQYGYPEPGYYPPPRPKATPNPTERPTPRPTPTPTNRPTPHPTPVPSARPTPQPTPEPTPMPTAIPTPKPSQRPTPNPTPEPTTLPPTRNPTPKPSTAPPTVKPTPRPTPSPTKTPSAEPSPAPSATPTVSHAPTEPVPSAEPSASPTKSVSPTASPTVSVEPSETPTESMEPSEVPTESSEPSEFPTQSQEPTDDGMQTIAEIICDPVNVDIFGAFCRIIRIAGLAIPLNDFNQLGLDVRDFNDLLDAVIAIFNDPTPPAPAPAPAPDFNPVFGPAIDCSFIPANSVARQFVNCQPGTRRYLQQFGPPIDCTNIPENSRQYVNCQGGGGGGGNGGAFGPPIDCTNIPENSRQYVNCQGGGGGNGGGSGGNTPALPDVVDLETLVDFINQNFGEFLSNNPLNLEGLTAAAFDRFVTDAREQINPDYTVFVPTNDALATINFDAAEFLSLNTVDQAAVVVNIARYHVFVGSGVRFGDLVCGQQRLMANGLFSRTSCRGVEKYQFGPGNRFDDYNCIIAEGQLCRGNFPRIQRPRNLEASNGIIHIVDDILLPFPIIEIPTLPPVLPTPRPTTAAPTVSSAPSSSPSVSSAPSSAPSETPGCNPNNLPGPPINCNFLRFFNETERERLCPLYNCLEGTGGPNCCGPDACEGREINDPPIVCPAEFACYVDITAADPVIPQDPNVIFQNYESAVDVCSRRNGGNGFVTTPVPTGIDCDEIPENAQQYTTC